MKESIEYDFKFAIKVDDKLLIKLVVNHLYILGYKWYGGGDRDDILEVCIKSNLD